MSAKTIIENMMDYMANNLGAEAEPKVGILRMI